MAQQDFFRDIRTAARLIKTPSAEADGGQLSAESVARQIIRAAIWLNPKSVDAFDPQDFADLPESQREELTRAVEEFKALAQTVPSEAPVSDRQYRQGRELFDRVAAAVRKIVLEEWMADFGRLMQDAEAWAARREWACRRQPKPMQETLLESYELERLLIQCDDVRLQLDPVARFFPGADGAAELSVIPSYTAVMIVRKADGWYVHIEAGKTAAAVQRVPWSEEAFLRAVEWLRVHG